MRPGRGADPPSEAAAASGDRARAPSLDELRDALGARTSCPRPRAGRARSRSRAPIAAMRRGTTSRRRWPTSSPIFRCSTINGTAKDALDYADNQETGLKVIAIGGDKLARGLTLEGPDRQLLPAHLEDVRHADADGTLVRLPARLPRPLPALHDGRSGRCSGTSPTPPRSCARSSTSWLRAAATPREYGLKVQSHPVLMVTSRLKMRTARNLMLSFSGQLLETVALYRGRDILEKNLEAAGILRSRLDRSPRSEAEAATEPTCGRAYLWEDVPAEDVVDFLGGYRTHPERTASTARFSAEFIRSMNDEGELRAWTVALIGGEPGQRRTFRRTTDIDDAQRSAKGRHGIAIPSAAYVAARRGDRSRRTAWHGRAREPRRALGSADPGRPEDRRNPTYRMAQRSRKI